MNYYEWSELWSVARAPMKSLNETCTQYSWLLSLQTAPLPLYFFLFSVYILQFSYWFAAAAVIVVVFLLQFCSHNFPCMKTESINWDKHFYLFSWDSCSFQWISSIYCSVLCIFLLVFFVYAFLSRQRNGYKKWFVPVCAVLVCFFSFDFKR